MNYTQNKEKLLSVLEGKFKGNELENKIRKLPQPVYFIKGDVSGIQDFIFTIPSKGASKELKARSVKIKKETDDKLNAVKGKMTDPIELYKGGGNFFLFANGCEKDLIDLQTEFEENSFQSNIYVVLTWLQVSEKFDIVQLKDELEKKSGKDKLKKFAELYNAFEVIENNGKRISETEDIEYKQVPKWTTQLLDIHNDLVYALRTEKMDIEPKDGNIIDFNFLAGFAEKRTGTAKIAVLKMDVDNLGKLFGKFPQIDENHIISESLNYFFKDEVDTLRDKGTFKDIKGNVIPFSENIYIVFSGGDDCFFIGGWDAVFEFAMQIRKMFSDFTNNQISISASLLVLSAHYPVIRFAESAEDELHRAKYAEKNVKNKISVFGEILTWGEFYKACELKETLLTLVNEKGESRAILERIKSSSIGFDSLQKRTLNGVYDFQKTWRLAYYLRNVKKSNRKFVDDNIVIKYQECLFAAFKDKKPTNAMLFPIAARWAELLTRKNN